ncbi:unnamed protein product [Paramecium sonneborni]|uniref:Calcium-dependent protein kinase n=1 Tax=Paramecium sonneborni TaxID=65129 RepID=A0A8S1Q624_9CILI|nr:unnamed protein product [Paramecium sonneborni]
MMHKILNRYVYSENDIVGHGAQSIVYRGIDCINKQAVAIKLLKPDDLQDQYSICKFQNEITIIKEFHSPNIVKFIDSFSDQKQNIAIFDYCEGGDLLNFLEDNQKALNEETALRILIQIVNSFREIISKGYVHRDVKPANILIKNGIFMMADFGFAVKATSYEIFEQPVGTPLYMAPQLLDNVLYTSKCDIWSLGIVAYQLIYGKQPWTYENYKSYLKNIRCYPVRFPSEKTLSEQYKNFIRQCLKIDERQRLNWHELFEHPIFHSSSQKQNINNILYENEFDNLILRHIQILIQIRKFYFEEQFQLFDINLEGTINQHQFFVFIQRVDPSLNDQEIINLFNLLDEENQHKLTQDKFKILFCNDEIIEFKSLFKKFISIFQDLVSQNKQKIENIFNYYDVKKVGRLRFEEFAKLIQRVMPTLVKFEQAFIFAKFDHQNVNSISLEDIKKKVSPEQKVTDKIVLKKIQLDIIKKLRQKQLTNEFIFKKYNQSRSNKLNLEEFKIFCKEYNSSLQNNEIKQLFKYADKNNDKVISYEEFNKFLN